MSRLSPRELDVLSILCNTDKPMTSAEIVNQQRELTQSTVIAVLRIFLKDELIEVTGATYSGKVLSRTYRITEKSKEVIMENFVSSYASFKNVVSKAELCASILRIKQSPDQMKSELSKLKEILDNYENTIC